MVVSRDVALAVGGTRLTFAGDRAVRFIGTLWVGGCLFIYINIYMDAGNRGMDPEWFNR